MEDDEVKSLIKDIRSTDEKEKHKALLQIPILLSLSVQTSNSLYDQLILIIYNLATNDSEKYERLNARNRNSVFRQLLKLYANLQPSSDCRKPDRLMSLTNLIKHSHSSEVLIEVANVLYRCLEANIDHEDNGAVHEALDLIFEKASISLQPEVILMIHSVWAALDRIKLESTENQ